MTIHNRIEVMHGVNFDMLNRRNADHYGDQSLAGLEQRVAEFGRELDLELRFFQSNSETRFVEHLHRLDGLVDAIVLNPGAWTHYSWAIHDALEIAALPAVEVHLSDVSGREPWRAVSVIEDLCVATVSGQGVDGYREALVRLKKELEP